MACFGFAMDPSCQYDPYHLISNKKKKQKRGRYEHQGTQEMEQMANQLSFPLGLLQIEQAQDMEILTLVPLGDKGKRKVGEELTLVNPQVTTSKKPRVVKDPFVQVVEYPTPTMETKRGKVINIKKAILEHYNSLNMQAEKEIHATQEQLRATQPQQLITALDKKSQMMKAVVIQPPVR